MLKVAMLSKWHVHANDYVNQLRAMERVKITTLWDEEPERGLKWARELGVDFEADLNVLLKRSDVDAVAVNTPTSMHKDVIVLAANAGKHVFTEKVMAATLYECREIAAAVKNANVKFCISFPHRTLPHNLFAKKAADEKLLGEITLLRIRNAHNGAIAGWLPAYFYDPGLCGGGAMIDLGAHPMYLSRWILGKPVRITSIFTDYTGKPVEDNAVCVIEYQNKAIAIVETGFVTTGSPYAMELYGTEGSLLIGGYDGRIQMMSRSINTPVNGYFTPTGLPERLPSSLQQWVGGILDGSPIQFGLEEGIQLTELMEAAYISHREKRQVQFNELRT